MPEVGVCIPFFENRENAIAFADNQGWPMTKHRDEIIAFHPDLQDFLHIVEIPSGPAWGGFTWEEI